MGSRPNQSMCKKEKETEKNTNNGSVSWIGYFFLLTVWTISIYSVLSLLSTNLKVGLYELWLSHTSIAIFMVIKWNKICGYFSKLLLPILFWMNLVSWDCVFKLNNSLRRVRQVKQMMQRDLGRQQNDFWETIFIFW